MKTMIRAYTTKYCRKLSIFFFFRHHFPRQFSKRKQQKDFRFALNKDLLFFFITLILELRFTTKQVVHNNMET